MKRIIIILLLIPFISLAANSDYFIQRLDSRILKDIQIVDNSMVVVVGINGTFLKSMDFGETWRQKSLYTNNYFKSVYFIDKSIGFIGGTRGTLAKTTDSGDSWEILQIPQEDYNSIEKSGLLMNKMGLC